MGDILSQNEIDSLLAALSSGEIDAEEYKDCLVYVVGTSFENAEQVLKRMLNNPNENDRKLIKGHTNLRITAVDKKDCWWNENCD